MALTPEELRGILTASWNNTIETMTPDELLAYRRIRINTIDGDEMPHLTVWPINIRSIFFKNESPLTDGEARTLFLFLLGNGYSALRAGTWILSSHALVVAHTRHTLANKRIHQLCWLYRNIRQNSMIWFYHDLEAGHNLSFNDYIDFNRN